MQHLGDKLVVAVSSRALFDLAESHRVYQEQGLEAYRQYQLEREDEPLRHGAAYPLVRRLLDLRYGGQAADRAGHEVCEVILTSRNDPFTGLRVFNSIEREGLRITRATFTQGRSPHRYLGPLGVQLFLSAEGDDVRAALQAGVAAATILEQPDAGAEAASTDSELRIAFDGDAVIFSDEAEQVYADKGLLAFHQSERDKAAQPLPPGPFKPLIEMLNRVQHSYAAGTAPLRISLVTARDAPAHKRAITTLRHWGVSFDEVFFLGGLDKSAVLAQLAPQIFFDDQWKHINSAAKIPIPAAHVPHGVANRRPGPQGPAR